MAQIKLRRESNFAIQKPNSRESRFQSIRTAQTRESTSISGILNKKTHESLAELLLESLALGGKCLLGGRFRSLTLLIGLTNGLALCLVLALLLRLQNLHFDDVLLPLLSHLLRIVLAEAVKRRLRLSRIGWQFPATQEVARLQEVVWWRRRGSSGRRR